MLLYLPLKMFVIILFLISLKSAASLHSNSALKRYRITVARMSPEAQANINMGYIKAAAELVGAFGPILSFAIYSVILRQQNDKIDAANKATNDLLSKDIKSNSDTIKATSESLSKDIKTASELLNKEIKSVNELVSKDIKANAEAITRLERLIEKQNTKV